MKQAPPPPPSIQRQVELAVGHVGGLDLAWNQQMQGQLEYCVSKPGFGARYDAVVRDMAAATEAWEGVAAVDFKHDVDQDGACGPTNASVVFDVRPVNVGGQYLARAFFPNEPRAERNVLIDGSSFELEPGGKLQLVGILRHELGHTIGFRHEHTRPSAGPCFEDNEWRPLTAYDPLSVMHYPQCNGQGDWSLTLTPRDQSGSACLYGAAAGFTIDPSLVTATSCRTPAPAPPTGVAKRQVFSGQSVALGAQKEYGPFAVVSGSLFEATMTGTGDPDLYVQVRREADHGELQLPAVPRDGEREVRDRHPRRPEPGLRDGARLREGNLQARGEVRDPGELSGVGEIRRSGRGDDRSPGERPRACPRGW